MKKFSTTFHKKFHIKFFLTKNYGFYVKNGRNLRPTLYVFHMWFSYVFFCKCYFFQFDFSSSVGKIALQRFFLDNAVLSRILFRSGSGLFKYQKRALFTVR